MTLVRDIWKITWSWGHDQPLNYMQANPVYRRSFGDESSLPGTLFSPLFGVPLEFLLNYMCLFRNIHKCIHVYMYIDPYICMIISKDIFIVETLPTSTHLWPLILAVSSNIPFFIPPWLTLPSPISVIFAVLLYVPMCSIVAVAFH